MTTRANPRPADGGGIIIIHQQNAVVRAQVNDPSVYGQLPAACKAIVDGINAKDPTTWSDADFFTMCGMPLIARHCVEG